MVTTELLIPGNETEAEAMFAKKLVRSYASEKIYPDARLEKEYETESALMEKHARLTIEHALECGTILFAMRLRKGYGQWGPYLKARGIHSKKAERLIKIALWWRFFPDNHPDTGLPWSPSSAYEALPRIKDAVWEQHGITADQRAGPVDDVPFEWEQNGVTEDQRTEPVDGFESPCDLQVVVKSAKRRGGDKDPVKLLAKRSTVLLVEWRHQILDMGRSDAAEHINALIAEFEAMLGQLEAGEKTDLSD